MTQRIPLYRCEKAGECLASFCFHFTPHSFSIVCHKAQCYLHGTCVHVGYRVEPHDTPMREGHEE